MRVLENVLLIALVVAGLLLCADWFMGMPMVDLGSLVEKALKGGVH